MDQEEKYPTHEELIEELVEKRAEIKLGGGQQRIDSQHAKGKRTARERILQLLDEGTFREIDAYLTHRHSDFGMDKKRYEGDAVVIGFGKIDGRMVRAHSRAGVRTQREPTLLSALGSKHSSDRPRR